MVTTISLGWGVQSFTLAAMSALGDLPRVDFAIHSDTTHEKQETYKFAEHWGPWLQERRIKVVTVNSGEAPASVWNGEMIPARSELGLANRSCTQRWKIAPMRRYYSEYLESRGLKKTPGIVKQWLGITTDEVERLAPSDVGYIDNQFPLIDRRYNRAYCEAWLKRNGLAVPPKSACVFCPFHSRNTWIDLKQRGGKDWNKAVEVDNAIRNSRPPVTLYLHRDLKPLTEAVITHSETGQLSIFDDSSEECKGYCFL